YAPEHTLGAVSYLALVIAGVCLLYEHSLVKHDDLGRVDAAFFTMNGVISIVFALLVILDVFVIG
ncbi:MAG: 4-hydroxybenzoate octaprenyltransferase, partial [Planctomycetes bacterium]|nr:4-hydroxybenzoate octaprenyltransferase [Planctomycetota bacterium]